MPSDRPPAGLRTAGRSFWQAVVADFEPGHDDRRLLEEAAREIDLIDRLERELRKSPLVTPGSRGQLRPNPLLPEIRAHRLTLARLLRDLALEEPAPTGEAAGTQQRDRQSKARRAALARWGTSA